MKGKDLEIKYKTPLSKYGINTPIKISLFLWTITPRKAVILIYKEKSLNYSVSGLLTTFSRK